MHGGVGGCGCVGGCCAVLCCAVELAQNKPTGTPRAARAAPAPAARPASCRPAALSQTRRLTAAAAPARGSSGDSRPAGRLTRCRRSRAPPWRPAGRQGGQAGRQTAGALQARHEGGECRETAAMSTVIAQHKTLPASSSCGGARWWRRRTWRGAPAVSSSMPPVAGRYRPPAAPVQLDMGAVPSTRAAAQRPVGRGPPVQALCRPWTASAHKPNVACIPKSQVCFQEGAEGANSCDWAH